jgi:glycine/D-amino acid oxidase-like deaminating enzyme
VNDVVVAGGGLIGLAVAWRCAQRGLSVTVVDEAPGAGASYAAAGMLAPVTEAAYGEERLLALCRASLDRFPAFVTELHSAGGAHSARRAPCLLGSMPTTWAPSTSYTRSSVNSASPRGASPQGRPAAWSRR